MRIPVAPDQVASAPVNVTMPPSFDEEVCDPVAMASSPHTMKIAEMALKISRCLVVMLLRTTRTGPKTGLRQR